MSQAGPPRRSSYASVLSGVPQPLPNPSSRTLPHPGGHADGHHAEGMPSSSWSKHAGLPPYSPFPHIDPSVPSFFIPSYLRGSRHAERLEEAHKVKGSAQKEGRSAHSSNAGSLSTSSSSVNLQKMVPSHRGMTHEVVERTPATSADPLVAPLPSRWSEQDKFNGLEILNDGLDVRFGAPNRTTHEEAAALRADHPMPKQCGIYYFEVTVLSKGKEGLIGIGFSGPKVPLNRLPGWEPDSWAYHGDDGFSFCCTSSGKSYGPKFSFNDVIGCGVNFRTGMGFFTKNGVHLGTAFRDLKSDKLYPSVGMKRPGEHLRANFGQTAFVYDIDSLVKLEKETIQAEISRTSAASLHPPLDETGLIHELIAQYLAHDGYVETARAFADEVRVEAKALANGDESGLKDLNTEEDVDAINRQRIRAAILEGDVDKALKLTKAFYPAVLRDNENIYFQLRRRKFIEMIKKLTELQSPNTSQPSKRNARNSSNGLSLTSHTPGINSADFEDVFDHQMELDDQLNISTGPSFSASFDERMGFSESDDAKAQINEFTAQVLKYGQELQEEFSDDPRKEVREGLSKAFALMAYTDPRESSIAGILDVRERVTVAEELNSAILVSLGKSSSAALERLCQQTEALVSCLGEDGGSGAFINVGRDFLN